MLGPRVLCFDHGGALAGELTDLETVEISANIRGPESARLAMSRTAIRNQQETIRPGYQGAYVRVDARSLPVTTGVPELWFGRAEFAETQTGNAVGTIPCRGPVSWLEREHAGFGRLSSGTVYGILADVIGHHPSDLRLRMGDAQHRGAGAPQELQGQTIADLMDELEQRGVWIRLRPSSEGAWCWVEVLDPGTPLDLSGEVTLHEGVNSEWDFSQGLAPGADEILAVGQSFMVPGGVMASGARAPSGTVLGRRGAYKAALSVPQQTAAPGGAVDMRPELASPALLEAATVAKLRETLPLPIQCPVQITDTALWSKIVPGILVSARCTSDPFGDFATALALIEQCTWSVTPPYALQCSVTLWASEVRGA